ncbi:MAG: hypothetical protein C4324_04235 [Blastocatellia bacterium]
MEGLSENSIRKTIILLLVLTAFATALPAMADAQTCRRKGRKAYSAKYYRKAPRYEVRGYTTERQHSFYLRHRNLINMGIGTAKGAVLAEELLLDLAVLLFTHRN